MDVRRAAAGIEHATITNLIDLGEVYTPQRPSGMCHKSLKQQHCRVWLVRTADEVTEFSTACWGGLSGPASSKNVPAKMHSCIPSIEQNRPRGYGRKAAALRDQPRAPAATSPLKESPRRYLVLVCAHHSFDQHHQRPIDHSLPLVLLLSCSIIMLRCRPCPPARLPRFDRPK